MRVINHGTRSGYYAHRRLNEPSCQPCRDAINEYVRQYRAEKQPERNARREAIRRRALSVLRDNHRAEYEDLVKLIEDLMEGESE